MKNKIKKILRPVKKHAIDLLRYIAQKNGYFLIRDHYYSAIPNKDDLEENYWQFQSQLVGIDINTDLIKELLESLNSYIREFREAIPLFRSLNISSTDNHSLHLINRCFMAVDAHIYYSLIRQYRPEKIVEIGSGFSTSFAKYAISKNERVSQITCIEPYPSDSLKEIAHNQEHINIIPKKLQEIDVNFFSCLKENDILFIDSTHMLRTGSDVQIEYCEILPRLAKGVLVHIHDISLPKHYPTVYFDNELFWNEQYLLQAFLAFNSKFEIIWAGNYMMLNHSELMHDKFPEILTMRDHFPMSEPTSFWIRVKT
jgi:predicted O-methyltransferase YrrM